MFSVRLCLPGIPHLSHNPLRRWNLMVAHPRPLIDVFAAMPDFRQSRGKRHALSAIFATEGFPAWAESFPGLTLP